MARPRRATLVPIPQRAGDEEGLMHGSITVRGVVATRPRHLVTADGLAVTSFRLVATPVRRERSRFTVSALRGLAVNAARSLAPGDPVVVSGRLIVREWAGDAPGATAEVEADAIGHDLTRGCSVFTRDGGAPDASPAKDG
jgi:single-strand DNA-binding protein